MPKFTVNGKTYITRPPTDEEWEDLKAAARRRNGRRLSAFRPKTEPDKKREAKKRGDYCVQGD